MFHQSNIIQVHKYIIFAIVVKYQRNLLFYSSNIVLYLIIMYDTKKVSFFF